MQPTLRAWLCWSLATPCALALLISEPAWPLGLRSVWQSWTALPFVMLGWAVVVNVTGLLTGTRARGHIAHPEWLDVLSRSIFLLFLLWIAAALVPHALAVWLLPLAPLYAASYLDGSEFTTHRFIRGARHAAPRWYHLHCWYPCSFYGWCLEHQGCKPSIRAHGAPPPADKQCLFGFHPHGVFPLGVQYTVGLGYVADARDVALPHAAFYDHRRMVVAVASFCFYVPLMREVHVAMRPTGGPNPKSHTDDSPCRPSDQHHTLNQRRCCMYQRVEATAHARRSSCASA